MKIKLVFRDWRKDGKSIYNTDEGIYLSSGAGQFHAGTTFKGEIELDEVSEKEIRSAMKSDYEPVFWIMPNGEENE